MQRIVLAIVLGLLVIPTLQADPDASLDEIDALIEAQQYEQALKILSEYPEDLDEAGLVSFHRARVHFHLARYDVAEDAIEEAIERDGANAGFHALKGAIHTRQINDAGIFSKMSLARKIKDEFRKAVELAPDNLGYRRNLLGYYLNAPGIAGGSTEKAREQAVAIADLDPAAGYQVRLLIHFKEEELDRAQELLREGVAAHPAESDLYATAVTGFGQAGAHERAHAAALAWRENLPEDAGALYQLGRLAAVSGRFLEEGEVALRAYLETEPDDGDPPRHWARFRLGLVLRELGKDAAAEEQFALAREQGRDDESLLSAMDELD